MATFAVRAVAIADQEIAAGNFLQEEAEVFCAHRRFEVVHIGSADHLGQLLARETGFGIMVDRWRVIALEAEFAAHLKRLGGRFGDLLHAALDQIKHLEREGAHRALDFAGIGHHVGGLAGVDHRDRNNAGIDRALVAGDDGLEGLHHLAGRRDRIDAVMRHRRMGALAAQGDLELVARGKHRAAAQRELTCGHAGPVVGAEDGLHRELLEQPVLDHLAGTAAAFFGRLEDQVDGAVEIAVLGQMLGRRQQHGGVAVMAAGVHLARMDAGMGELVVLGHRQGVDVGTQAHRALAGAVLDDPDDAGLAQPPVYRNAPVGQLLGNQLRGAVLLETQLGMGVNVTPEGGDALGIGKDRLDQFHTWHSVAGGIPIERSLDRGA